MTKKTQVDGLAHSRDESTELCVYHLRMAYAHFMNGAEALEDWNEELQRQLKESYGMPGEFPFHLDWIAAMTRYHEELAKEHS